MTWDCSFDGEREDDPDDTRGEERWLAARCAPGPQERRGWYGTCGPRQASARRHGPRRGRSTPITSLVATTTGDELSDEKREPQPWRGLEEEWRQRLERCQLAF